MVMMVAAAGADPLTDPGGSSTSRTRNGIVLGRHGPGLGELRDAHAGVLNRIDGGGIGIGGGNQLDVQDSVVDLDVDGPGRDVGSIRRLEDWARRSTTTPLKRVPSALKSVSLMVVRGGVASSFELSARRTVRTHSSHDLKRNILTSRQTRGFRLQVTHGLGVRSADARALPARVNFQRGKDFGREEF